MNSLSPRPYDYFEALEMLKNQALGLTAEQREKLKTMVALNASDPLAIELYADLKGDDWASLCPDHKHPDRKTTTQAIDTFLESYGNTSPEENALLERLIFNPVPEYGGVLERQENGEDAPVDMADVARSINTQPTGTPVSDTKPEKATENSEPVAENEKATASASAPTKRAVAAEAPLSLELAKIFVKQGHFERAHEIISKIVLKNPEKSVYFADQLRFLEKLIKIKQLSTI